MLVKKIPFFDYVAFYKSQEEVFLSVTRDVGGRGAFIMQGDLEEFELAIAAYTGAKYAVGVANATDGLQMAMMTGGIDNGDEVIFCSHTMVATASAIHFAGAKPIPVEAGVDHLIDPDKIEKAITARTKAICPTQLNGRTAAMDKIEVIAEQYGLQIYEDAAQALGSKWKGKSAGTFGVASCISFYPAKILGCLGDGGLVLTNDRDIYHQLLLMRDHGRQGDDVVMWGFNSRLDNMQAAYLYFQFKNYQKTINRRRSIASRYEDNLNSLKEIILPPAPESDPDHFDVFQNYEIEAERRDDLQKYLTQVGVGTIVQWGGKAVHQFKKLGFNQSLPVTERLFNRMLLLPMNMSLSDDEIDYISDSIIKFYR